MLVDIHSVKYGFRGHVFGRYFFVSGWVNTIFTNPLAGTDKVIVTASEKDAFKDVAPC